MNRAWAAFKAHPYISNVLGYTALFASADLIQQRVLGKKPAAEGSSSINWHQTARVATVGFCFHANFNYHWLRWLERMLPGGGVKVVAGKVVLDQLVGAPLTISAFYIGCELYLCPPCGSDGVPGSDRSDFHHLSVSPQTAAQPPT
ncbi:mpv17-like protein isoform X2 [Austrofundulus limnaeus]|uniref:Mpv17-like protein isoform X2 n=1 Tax=Austrofundulus limnaeus TaxID=52670 RepID=A0A2I4BKC4_AUSLI|nr:PREDICTED: mpv17-like protein isoform X2 [Austrofundulus limnaeus]